MVLISSKLSIHPLSSALCKTGSWWQLRAQWGNQKFFSKVFPVIASVTAKVAVFLLKITFPAFAAPCFHLLYSVVF